MCSLFTCIRCAEYRSDLGLEAHSLNVEALVTQISTYHTMFGHSLRVIRYETTILYDRLLEQRLSHLYSTLGTIIWGWGVIDSPRHGNNVHRISVRAWPGLVSGFESRSRLVVSHYTAPPLFHFTRFGEFQK